MPLRPVWLIEISFFFVRREKTSRHVLAASLAQNTDGALLGSLLRCSAAFGGRRVLWWMDASRARTRGMHSSAVEALRVPALFFDSPTMPELCRP